MQTESNNDILTKEENKIDKNMKITNNESFKRKLDDDDNNSSKKIILKKLRNTIVIRISMTIMMLLINDL